MERFGKVGVLMGGLSAEREVSLMSGAGVLKALHQNGVDAYGFDTGLRSITDLIAQQYDVVFIAQHGRYGEDGTLQGLLEHCKIPYTGSGVMASAIAMDKVMTKVIWKSHDLPTARYATVQENMDTQLMAKRLESLGYPFMLKAPHEGSSIGIRKVSDISSLQDSLRYCFQYDMTLLAEEFIGGRELTVAIICVNGIAKALPVVEIVAPHGDYNFHHKYYSNDTRYICPATLNRLMTEELQTLAIRAFETLGCSGWGRVDFILQHQTDMPFLLEINTSPGMTSHSLVPMSAKRAGISYESLCLDILSSASLKVKSTPGNT